MAPKRKAAAASSDEPKQEKPKPAKKAAKKAAPDDDAGPGPSGIGEKTYEAYDAYLMKSVRAAFV